MRKTLLTFAFILLSSLGIAAQEQTVTIAQETADKCADCFNASKQKDIRISALELSVTELTAEIAKLRSEKSELFGELNATKAESARYFSLVQVCLQKGRAKQFGLINLKLGGQ